MNNFANRKLNQYKSSQANFESKLESIIWTIDYRPGCQNQPFTVDSIYLREVLPKDVLEDSEEVCFADIESEFGPRVAEIVDGLSDAKPGAGESKAPWKERKLTYLDHLATVEDDSILKVSCADKLHNARSILSDLNDPRVGVAVWDKFNASRDGTLWYYDSLVKIFQRRLPETRLASELEASVAAFHSAS